MGSGNKILVQGEEDNIKLLGSPACGYTQKDCRRPAQAGKCKQQKLLGSLALQSIARKFWTLT